MTIDELEALGFDACHTSEDGGIRVRCSQCDAIVINGAACHENGCPNRPRLRRCWDCGCDVAVGESCCEAFHDQV